MIYIVSCDQNMQIQLPGGISPEYGASFPCPSDCPLKRLCSMRSDSFRASSSRMDDGHFSPSGGLVRYSAEEVHSKWHGNALQSYPDFGGDGEIEENEDFAELKPKVKYKQIMLNMQVFSDDDQVRWSIPMSRPLGVAMEEIFQYWNTDAVFLNDKELKDDFVWLIVSCAKDSILQAEVDVIMNNSSFNRSQKFFHLFYDVIYKDKRPDGFYWCDSNRSYQPLMPKFGNKDEFVNYLINSGQDGLNFYKKRRTEVLSYLEVENEAELFAEITCEYARLSNKILWIDPDRGNSAKDFGTKEIFVQNMHIPPSYSTMVDMLAFLEKYTVSAHGVFGRHGDMPFERVSSHSSVDESLLYSLVGLKSQDCTPAAYEVYLSLLREYIRSFAPKSVTIGPIKFTGGKFMEECEGYILKYLKELLVYSGGKETSESKQLKKGAYLAASLVGRKVFTSYDSRNNEDVKNLINLMNEMTPGSAKCNIKYYLEKFKPEDTVKFAEQVNDDPIVMAWLEEAVGKIDNSEINNTINKYDNLYRQFIRSC